jgi:Rrf2 family protein
LRISTKGRYGARAMLALALRYDEGPVRAADIAKDQGISIKYLEAILSLLKAAGLVHVRRGVGGGYRLSRPPEQITLFDVLEPLEDFLGIVHCTTGNCDCERMEECLTRRVWEEMRDMNREYLRKKTLAGIIEEDRRARDREAV